MKRKGLQQKGKRFLAVFMAVAMCLSLLPVYAFAEENDGAVTVTVMEESEDAAVTVAEESEDTADENTAEDSIADEASGGDVILDSDSEEVQAVSDQSSDAGEASGGYRR